MELNLLDSSESSDILSIEELRASRVRKNRIENEKRSRKYISDINKRHIIWTEKKYLFK